MADREPLDPSTEESPVPADFDWTLTAADDRFRRHGAALFRVRSWSLRVPSLIGFGGVYLALHIAPGSKALALIVLAAFVLPAIALAPGLTIATLTAARDRTPSGWELLDGVGRAPGYALLSLLHFFARGVAGPFADLRLSLARFLFIDTDLGVGGALRDSAKLTAGTMTAQIKLAVHASFDDAAKPTCPRCRDVNLLSTRVPFALELCTACGGTWVGLDVAQKLAAGTLTAKDAAVASACPTPKRGVDLTPAIACPTCAATMQRSFQLSGRVSVDACPSHGAWFDYGEIVKVARGIEQANRDRKDVADLVRHPPEQTNVYLRGLGIMASDAASAALDVGKTTIDSAMEGTESEREEMFVSAAAAAIAIVTQDDKER